MKSNVGYYSFYQSPVGELTLTADGDALTGLYFDRSHSGSMELSSETKAIRIAGRTHEDAVFDELKLQLDEYFRGHRTTFRFNHLAIAPSGLHFNNASGHSYC